MKDKQSELDELRAKRAQEEAERQYRRKEEAAAQRMASINVSLSEARVAQKLEKERRLMENALNEKAEFSRILKVQKEYEAIEAADRGKRAEAIGLEPLCKNAKEKPGQIGYASLSQVLPPVLQETGTAARYCRRLAELCLQNCERWREIEVARAAARSVPPRASRGAHR